MVRAEGCPPPIPHTPISQGSTKTETYRKESHGQDWDSSKELGGTPRAGSLGPPLYLGSLPYRASLGMKSRAKYRSLKDLIRMGAADEIPVFLITKGSPDGLPGCKGRPGEWLEGVPVAFLELLSLGSLKVMLKNLPAIPSENFMSKAWMTSNDPGKI